MRALGSWWIVCTQRGSLWQPEAVGYQVRGALWDSSACVDRSSRPLDRLRSHSGADFSYPLWPSSQPHSARPSTRLAKIWSSLAVAAGVLAVAISTPPFGLAPILQDLPHDFSSNRGIYPSRWTRGSRCEGASAAVLADLQCIIACPWAPCTPHSPKSSIAGAI